MKILSFIVLLFTMMGCGTEDGDPATMEAISVKLYKSDLLLKTNQTYRLSASYSPADAQQPKYIWSSSNGEIVSVNDEGEVTALSAGIATVTVTAVQKEKVLTASCHITVSAPSPMPISQSLAIQGNFIRSAVDFNNAAATGAKYLRRGFGWESIEKQAGVYDFSEYDIWVEEAANNGFGILATLAFNNKLYEPDGKRAIRTEGGRQAYAKFAGKLVERYKNYNIIWEIWNEPNTKSFWDPDNKSNTAEYAKQYVALVNTAVPVMRQADPHCTIVALSMSAIWEESLYWMDQCGSLGLFTSSGIDGITVHPYGFQWPELCSERTTQGYKPMFDILAKYDASDLPVFNGETGYSLTWLEGRGVPPEQSEVYQAWMFLRQVMVDQIWGLKMTTWYRWSTQDLDYTIVKGDGSFRPVYFAYMNLTNQLNGYNFVKKIAVDNPDDYLLAFENQFEEGILVAWTTPTDGEPIPKLPNPHDITIPVSGTGTLDVYDYVGTHSTVNIINGKVKIHLDGGPRYIKLK